MAETKQGTQIKLPKLGESVTEGTIAGWFKQVGDTVEKYEPMVEIITDKVNAEVPAPVAGTIVEILSQEGDVVPVGQAICIIDEAGDGTVEQIGAEPSEGAPAEEDDGEDRTVVMSAAHIDEMEPAAEMLISEEPRRANGGERDSTEDIASARERRDDGALLQIRSSPLVRRLAEEHDIDLRNLDGSGIGGRVTKSDIEAFIQARGDVEVAPEPAHRAKPAAEPAREPTSPTPDLQDMPAQPQEFPAQAPSVQLMPGDEVVEASTMRRQIAEHMTRSVQTAPHVTVWMEVDMSSVVQAREAHKAEFADREGFSLTFVPLVMSVLIDALREQPEINAVWDNGRIIRRKSINIGIAVALDDGLIVPVLKGADEKNLTGLARGINDLVTRTRDGKLTPDDVTGGTFTLNNPGALGSVASTPILVQPQAAILSMEAIVKRPVVIDDMIGVRPMMNLSLSVDHRLLDGLAATRFLARIKQGLEAFPEDVRV